MKKPTGHRWNETKDSRVRRLSDVGVGEWIAHCVDVKNIRELYIYKLMIMIDIYRCNMDVKYVNQPAPTWPTCQTTSSNPTVGLDGTQSSEQLLRLLRVQRNPEFFVVFFVRDIESAWWWLEPWNFIVEFYCSIIGKNHHPNWRRHIFQRGRYTTNQEWFTLSTPFFASGDWTVCELENHEFVNR